MQLLIKRCKGTSARFNLMKLRKTQLTSFSDLVIALEIKFYQPPNLSKKEAPACALTVSMGNRMTDSSLFIYALKLI